MERKAYPSDVSDQEWAFVAPYLTLMTQEAPQGEHSLREVFNGLRWLIRAGADWRMMPHEPLWAAVYQQTQRWFNTGVFEAIVDDLRVLLRLASGLTPNRQPSGSIVECCNQLLKVVNGQGMTVVNVKKEVKYTLLSIHWGIC